jgi:hypothetical protein
VGAVIDAVGEEMTQPGKQLVDGADDKPGTIAILHIGGVHLGPDQQTTSIGHNVALTPFDLLGRIVTTRPTALGGLGRLAVNDPRRRARFAAHRLARARSSVSRGRPKRFTAGMWGSISAHSASVRSLA